MTITKCLARFIALVLVVLVQGGEVRAESAYDLPEVLYQEGYETPVWVSAEATLDEAGEPIPGMFRGDALEGIESVLASPIDGRCTPFHTATAIESIPFQGQQDLLKTWIRESSGIVRGRVTAADGGFYLGSPGTLLRFETIEFLAGEPSPGSRLIYVPVGRFKLGGREICALSGDSLPPPPIGAEMIVVIPADWDSVGSPFLIAGSWNFYPISGARVESHERVRKQIPDEVEAFRGWIQAVRGRR